jgi:hypothetical protein
MVSIPLGHQPLFVFVNGKATINGIEVVQFYAVYCGVSTTIHTSSALSLDKSSYFP